MLEASSETLALIKTLEWGAIPFDLTHKILRGIWEMKKFVKCSAALSLVASLGLAATAAHADTATATATAVIVDDVTLTKDADLSFGSLAAGATAGTATVGTNGIVSCTGGTVCPSGTTATGTAAAFSIAGTTGLNVAVNVPATVQLVSGTDTMDVTLSSSSTGMVLDGTDAFTVTGTLAVAANQAAGTYTKDFDVEVIYQ